MIMLGRKTVKVLAKTVEDLNTTTIYADILFTIIELVEYLKDIYGCRYVGTASEIFIARRKDNKVVTLISIHAGIDSHWKRKANNKVERVKSAIDKSDMYLYTTPLKSRRWYIIIVSYTINLPSCNDWLLYKIDYLEDDKNNKPNTFRLQGALKFDGK